MRKTAVIFNVVIISLLIWLAFDLSGTKCTRVKAQDTVINSSSSNSSAIDSTDYRRIEWVSYSKTGNNIRAQYLSIYGVTLTGEKKVLLATPIDITTTYKVMPLSFSGDTYQGIAMTATDSSGLESALSNIVSLVLDPTNPPDPPVLLRITDVIN